MQQYYTLEEAASKLMLSPDDLREMAKSKKIRAFQDKGSWRFRTQDVEEEARKRGVGSEPELAIGEAPPRKSTKPPGKSKLRPDEDVLAVDFDLEQSGAGPRSGSKKSSGPKSPRPKAGSDSDVRLVQDSELDFKIDEAPKPASKSPTKSRKSKIAPGDSGVKLSGDKPSDSDVKVVPAANDSDVKPRPSKSPSDSDIRLQDADEPGKKRKDGGAVTEEVIDLDAEEAELSKTQPKPGKKRVSPSSPALPVSSPFELSEDDLDLDEPKKKTPSGKVKKSGLGKKGKGRNKDEDSSSDFELIPFDSTKSPVELGSGEIPLLAGDEDVDLGAVGDLAKGAGNSGINIDDPADSGISLEEDDSDEFELTLESGSAAKPKSKPKPSSKPAKGSSSPAKGKSAPPPKQEEMGDDSSSEFELSVGDDSSSEFELSLDDDGANEDSSSEFELSLDDSGETAGLDDSDSESGSDSEFELTLDDEGNLGGDEDAGEVFESTNFDVPALEDDESASEAVALDEEDTDLDGDDFEISLDEESDSDSASQVVAIDGDEEEADVDAPTIARPKPVKGGKGKGKAAPVVVEEEEDEAGMDFDIEESTPKGKKKPVKKPAVSVEDEDDADEEDEEETEQPPAPAPEWGVLPALMLMPAVVVLFLVGIMGYELSQGQFGYSRPAKGSKPVVDWIARPVADAMDTPLPKEQ